MDIGTHADKNGNRGQLLVFVIAVILSGAKDLTVMTNQSGFFGYASE
jgi:hypothetical protein